MSRTGKQTIVVPDKVKVKLAGLLLKVEGPLGKLEQEISALVELAIADGKIDVKRHNDEPQSRAFHGLTRALVSNMVQGVSEGFKKELDITGVGYRADVKGKVLNLSLGFSHPVEYPIWDGLEVKVDKQTHIEIKGADKQQVGQFAANVRELRPPEPYKGKGIRYSDEVIRRKAGKTAGGK